LPFVAAGSRHPLVAHAVGEVAGRVLDAIGPAPDLAVLFAGRSVTGALDDIVGGIRSLLRPVVLVGCTASSVLADATELGPHGIALWAGIGFEATASREPVDGGAFALADPFSVPAVDGVVGWASAARARGGNRLVLDDAIHDDGAVFVAIDGVATAPHTSDIDDLVDARPLACDGALVFAGDGHRREAIAVSEAVGGAPLAGMRGAASDRRAATVVSFRH
jgi:small ligand-binding sensory domain FIST